MSIKKDYAKPINMTKNVKNMATKKKQPKFYKVKDTIVMGTLTTATCALSAYTYMSIVGK